MGTRIRHRKGEKRRAYKMKPWYSESSKEQIKRSKGAWKSKNGPVTVRYKDDPDPRM